MKKAVESLLAANEEKVLSPIFLTFFVRMDDFYTLIIFHVSAIGSQDRGASTVTHTLQKGARHGHVCAGKER